jgi:hypothetical protein
MAELAGRVITARLAREQITMTSLLTSEAFARPAPAGS